MNIEKSLLTRLSETFDEYRTERRHNRVQEAGSKPVRAGRFLQWVVPNGGTLLLIIILVTTVRVWARPLINTTNVPGPNATTVNYQGRLANSDGTPLTEDGVAMSFAIYDAEEGGNLIWPPSGSEDHVVDVSDGLFSVGLGSKTSGGIPTTTWNGDRFLEITVGGETLSPRELIRSVPIAGMALTVPDGAIESSKMSPTVWYSTVDNDILVAECATGVEYTDVLEAQITNDFDATYLIWASVLTRVDDVGKTVQLRLKTEDGSLSSWMRNAHSIAGTGGTQTGSMLSFVDLPAGTHTVFVSACRSPDTTGYVRQGTAMGIMLVSQ